MAMTTVKCKRNLTQTKAMMGIHSRLGDAKTAIVCTVSPVLVEGSTIIDEYKTKERIEEIVETEMRTIIRVNFSHVNTDVEHENVKRLMEICHEVSEDRNMLVGIMVDVCGPRVRLGRLEAPVKIASGDAITLADGRSCNQGQIPVNTTYPQFFKDVKEGERVLIDEGQVRGRIVGKTDTSIDCTIYECPEGGHELGSNKAINIPDSDFTGTVVTAKDERDLAFALQLTDKKGGYLVDYVAQSFVRYPHDYDYLYERIQAYRMVKVAIIAKIETEFAIKNIQRIAEKFDGIMVARGDLGVNTSFDKVPEYQSIVIKAAKRCNKPVIIATQMMESMLRLYRHEPLRAEGTDVWLAAKEADAIMTSAETVQSRKPGDIVRAMSRIAKSAEASRSWSMPDVDRTILRHRNSSLYYVLAKAACELADNRKCVAIVISTYSGDGAKWISAYRPAQPIVAITTERATAMDLLLYSGVYPVLALVEYSHELTTEEYISMMRDILAGLGLRGKNNGIISLFGIEPGQSPVGPSPITNTVRLFGLD